MLFSEFEQVIDDPNSIKIDPLFKVDSAPDGVCVVDGFYPLVIAATSRFFPRSKSVQVLDEEGCPLGELLTCAGEPFALPQFSSIYLASYLVEISSQSYGLAGFFRYDYLLIHEGRLGEYKDNYLQGSAVWGGFEHQLPPVPLSAVTGIDPIRATKGIALPTNFHIETARRSLIQPFAFERFLKLYHLLELSFDLDIVKKIQALGPDLRGVGQLFSNIDSNELNRLNQIIQHSRNPARVTEFLKLLTADTRWHSHIKTIFFEFGKTGNPAANKQQEFLSAIEVGNGYTLEEMQTIASLPRGHQMLRQEAFDRFSLRLAAYWIYRVRSSIAHNRIGEYLMSDEDEPFVAFFAEPLLRCILTEIL